MTKNETMVLYDGRMMPASGFRAFIYAPDGKSKLVNSWDEFQEHMQTGIWFSDMESALKVSEKTKPQKKGD